MASDNKGNQKIVYSVQEFLDFAGLPDNGNIKHILQIAGEKMQSTGLKDKNGKEIFEGDIVKTEEGIAEVKWLEHGFVAICKDKINSEWMHNLIAWEDECEIIGNIYEDSHLIKDLVE